jgi:signal transduction histidine kinase
MAPSKVVIKGGTKRRPKAAIAKARLGSNTRSGSSSSGANPKSKAARLTGKLEQKLAALSVEHDELLLQQAASAQILRVINASRGDLAPVLDAMLASAGRLCGVEMGAVAVRDGDRLHYLATMGVSESYERFLRESPQRIDRTTAAGRAILTGQVEYIRDLVADPEYAMMETVTLGGYRSLLGAPLIREGEAIGAIVLGRRDTQLLTERQIALVKTFADQAVIAMENARLLGELRESLEQQTATAEILRVISQSPTDVQPVLDAVAKAAVKFCGAEDAVVTMVEGTERINRAHEGRLSYTHGRRAVIDGTSLVGLAVLERRTMHVPDLLAENAAEFTLARTLAREGGYRASLAAPMLREGEAIGALMLRKVQAKAFSDRQIALLETFAAQAVIAIENVRLFTELRESLEQQTATSEILSVISQSPTDVQPVLTAVAKAALRFCGAEDVGIFLREGEQYLMAAHEGPMIPEVGVRYPLSRQTAPGQAMLDSRTAHFADIGALDSIEYAAARDFSLRHGFKAAIAAPMLREGTSIGAITLRRSQAGAFTPRQIELLETFAAQAVIAIENVRLFTELRTSLERLKAAQANLIQAEKMASLGQLAAGIAHEIKNPLNFVNNFSGLTVELLEELRQAAEPALAQLDEDKRAEMNETVELIAGNLAKIAEHGRRADGIIKSMLAHSRGGTGDWQASSIDNLVEEALNLAYHGARAQDKDFNVSLERDLAAGARPIDVVPQDITRVFLNLFSNGFYATSKRGAGGGAGYRPTLRVATRELGEAVEIKVRDNGIGIAADVREKLFQPFFTTKPTGEGTGLGLSISYDIVTLQHGGTIEVASEPGQYTEFTVRLPRMSRAATGTTIGRRE